MVDAFPSSPKVPIFRAPYTALNISGKNSLNRAIRIRVEKGQ